MQRRGNSFSFLYHSQFRRLECSFWLFLSFAAFSFPRAHTAFWLCSTRSLLFICASLFVYPLPNSLFIVGFGCQLPLKHNTPDRKRACNTGDFLRRLAIPMGFTLGQDLQPDYADPIALNCALFVNFRHSKLLYRQLIQSSVFILYSGRNDMARVGNRNKL